MINVIRSEWIKFRTIRMNRVLGFVAVALPVVITVLYAALAKTEDFSTTSSGAAVLRRPPTAEDVFRLLTSTSIIMVMLVGVIGASAITGEFSTNTIRPTFAATPRRLRVVFAKVVVTKLAVAVIAAVVVGVSLAAASAILDARGSTDSFADVHNLPVAAVGMVIFAIIVGLFGLAVGLLVKSTPAAIAVVVLWPLLIENLIGILLEAIGVTNAGKWLPYRAGGALFRLEDADRVLSRWAGGGLFLGLVVVLLALGTFVTSRRDA